jgi:hypothetical protein
MEITMITTKSNSAFGASTYTQLSHWDTPFYEGSQQFSFDRSTQHRRGWPQVIDELLRIRQLPDNWDGEGTEAPHPLLVDGAITLAQMLQSNQISVPDRVYASVNSTIYFEWLSPLGYCEFEVVSPVRAESRSTLNGSSTVDVIYFHRQKH